MLPNKVENPKPCDFGFFVGDFYVSVGDSLSSPILTAFHRDESPSPAGRGQGEGCCSIQNEIVDEAQSRF